MEIKVTKKDLIGELENFPIKVVEKMLQRQYEQVGKTDISVFQKYSRSDIQKGGFHWADTVEGHGFWYSVIAEEKFDMFFTYYPISSKNVYIWGHPTKGKKVIEALKERGGLDRCIGYAGDRTDSIYYIDPITSKIELCNANSTDRTVKSLFNMVTTYHEKIEINENEVELTLDEIAEKLGIDVNKLRIKK